MAQAGPPFAAEEYRRRLAAVHAAMEAAGLAVLHVSDPANMAWLTGYDGWSFYMHQGVIVPAGEEPVWWGRAQDVNGALRTVWMVPERIVAYGEHYVQTAARHPMQDLAGRLAEMGLGRERIGVEADSVYFTGRALDALRAALPGADIADATALVNWCRVTKSGAEIDFMRRAGRISQKIIEGIFERIEPGLPKHELVAGIFADGISGVGEDWGDYPAIVPLLPSGADASATHLTWDGRPFAEGEATFFEISGCYRRYHAPFCRTVFLGAKPPADLRAAERAVVAGLEAALGVARAGRRACDLAEAIKAEFRKAGIDRAGRVGYPVGLAYPPDWGERTISIREDDETVLQAGMCFHIMPGLWSAAWGLEITETILIRENAPAECLVEAPRRLIVKG